MKKYHIKNFILFLMIAGLIWSCTKDDEDLFDPYTSSYKGKLHKFIMYYDGFTDSTAFEYKYDIDGNVTSLYMQESERDFVDSWIFVRNSSGQITSYINQQWYDVKYYHNYIIGADDKYVSAEAKLDDRGNIRTIVNETYNYNGNQIIQIDLNYNNRYEKKIFLYDKKGNILKEETFDASGTLEKKTEYTYDTKKNPVESLELPFYLTYGSFPYYSENNILTSNSTHENGNIYNLSFTYSYNKFDKPASGTIISQTSNGSSYVINLKYIYY